MTKLKKLQETFKQKGLTIKAAKADEDTEDYVSVIEDQDGDIKVYHFYLAWLSLVPMVEIYFFNSFRRREKNKLRKHPERFLEGFDKYMLYVTPDIEMTEAEWAKEG